MCGIASLAIGRRARGRISYPLLQRLAKELLLELQLRGTDATGIAVINEGADSIVYKKPLKSDRLVVRPMFERVLSSIGPQTNFVLLHTRASSVGGTELNFNNHPIIVEPIVGIHNGTLYNEDRLFKAFSEEFDRDGDVDSEIIFKLYLYYIGEGLAPKMAMAQVSKLLYGAFTGALVDMRHPHRMVMFKNERPLCIIRIPHFDLIVGVSEACFYGRAVRRIGMTAKEKCELLLDGTGIEIDLNTDERITNRIVDFDLPVETANVSRYNSWLSRTTVW